MRNHFINTLAAISLLSANIAMADYSLADPISEPLPYSVIDQGVYSVEESKKLEVITDQGTLAARYYAENPSGGTGLPIIDFNKYLVLGIYMGTQPSGGFMIEVVDVREKDNKVIATVNSIEPGQRCAVITSLTSPYQLVQIKIPHAPMQVVFKETNQIIECE
ncbi:protease complex subunit PrcB family protein [Spartinivicinus poritis]|uniref:Protease complex subunit PrcB family protein n=1 Tax=Spartinivicinus poritis TaxID=2994640 RepID=A0ABT5U2H9_9GAMM|nr:protease complex subunit PrcB family protein [Spartinivicinus sp. A2-2]MDE1460566.1 protease complex subunit PrcB family protein [Spartinivicinus sp. A2-2]